MIDFFRRADAWGFIVLLALIFSGGQASGTSLCGSEGCLRIIYSGNLNGNLAPCG